MSARKRVANAHAAAILRERNQLLAAVKRLTREMRRLELLRMHPTDETEIEACEALVKWANRRANTRRIDRKLLKDFA